MSTVSLTHVLHGSENADLHDKRLRGRHHGRTLLTILMLSGMVLMPFAAFAQARAATASIETVDVVVDHAKVVRLPEKVQTVIVGNPAIADVTVQKNGILVVTGKSYGVTNLIALDSAGAMLAESHIRVQAKTESVLTVHRGGERETYSCAPKCQPSLQMGDSSKHFDGVGGQVTRRNQMATEQQK